MSLRITRKNQYLVIAGEKAVSRAQPGGLVGETRVGSIAAAVRWIEKKAAEDRWFKQANRLSVYKQGERVALYEIKPVVHFGAEWMEWVRVA